MTLQGQNLKRLIVTFSAKCALSCPFCYAPFNGVQPSERNLADILTFAQNEGIDIITFGGGDPFHYSFFREIVRRAKELGFFVHVDTHGLGIRESDFELIRNVIDIVGLPMDGQQSVHDEMRQRAGHFQLVSKVYSRLLQEGNKVKINSVVSSRNFESLRLLAGELRSNAPAIWSLYQFMEIPAGSQINQRYAISKAAFQNLAHELRREIPHIRVEVGDAERRKSGYLFVQTDGTLFTSSQDGPGYTTLGNIHTSEWREKFFISNSTLLPQLSVGRYLTPSVENSPDC